jgi:hypothetical protein
MPAKSFLRLRIISGMLICLMIVIFRKPSSGTAPGVCLIPPPE